MSNKRNVILVCRMLTGADPQTWHSSLPSATRVANSGAHSQMAATMIAWLNQVTLSISILSSRKKWFQTTSKRWQSAAATVNRWSILRASGLVFAILIPKYRHAQSLRSFPSTPVLVQTKSLPMRFGRRGWTSRASIWILFSTAAGFRQPESAGVPSNRFW